MNLAELREARVLIAVAAQAMVENLDVTRAVHRLDRVVPLVRRLRKEHVLAERLHVPGAAPHGGLPAIRSVDFLIARRSLLLAHVGNQRLEQRPTFRMPEDGTR